MDLRGLRTWTGDGALAGLAAALPSGLPSTLHALATGRDPLEAARAAGSILRPGAGEAELVLASVPVHVAVSIGWATVLAATLPRNRTVLWGGIAGAAIALLDLQVAARRWPRVRALPQLPQYADHVAFGAIAGRVIARRRSARAEA